ncbi:glycine-rich domain-containing protein [Belliella kenyensis]|uniref:Glycine-rich domain-containing protein n=1 Tax=Belliella kenyensis TaxID=1472724 RepID=A0ABV8EK81_9BACT|nr:hypothetical protein [Belliella kenyensis]MCH7402302.1 hypothetical protein [Belliella kenyensis]MDN3603493.1 hypothetical protein [Belliella kenyensis]
MRVNFYFSSIFLFIILCLGLFSEVVGQCTGCNVTINGNNTHSLIQNGNVVCIQGNRTSAISFNNANNVTICIADGASLNADFNNLSGLSTINNFGNFTARASYNGSWTINNSGFLTLNFESLNSDKTINNSGTLTRTGNFTINGTLNSSGISSISGNMTVNGSGRVDNSGSVSVGGNYQSNGQTNSADGEISIVGNLTNNGSGVFSVASGSIGGNVTNNGNINIYGSLNIQGNLNMNSGANISAGDSDQFNYLFVNGDMTGAGCLSGSNGILFSNKFSSSSGGCRNGEVFIGLESGCLQVIDRSTGSETFERIYIFTCSTGWTIPGSSDGVEPFDEAEILIVAGGGGGGRGTSAGGGGAGGLIYVASDALPFGTEVPVIVGIGGEGSSNANNRGGQGSISRFLSYTAVGGGGGGSNGNERAGGSGGSGGGGANSNGSGGGRTLDQGSSGGNGNDSGGSNRSGGGGGGAGGSGQSPSNGNNNPGGNGGIGILNGISGSNIFFSGGGGGTGQEVAGIGGSGVGGNGNNNGPGGNGSTPGSAGGAGSSAGGGGANGIVIIRQSFRILPVEFLEVTASYIQNDRAAIISWATAKEWENSHFEVERSINNVANFEKIAEVEGVGYADDRSDYKFVDKNLPLLGATIYYRLKQVDFSGSYAYSKTVAVRIADVANPKGTWRAYPNPTVGESLKISLINGHQYHDEPLSFRLVHPTYMSPTFSAKSEQEMNDQLALLLPNVPKGVFVVEVLWGQNVEHLKVLRK